MIPMARKVWQPIGAAMPAAAARRRIIRLASGWLIGLSESALPLWPRARNCDFFDLSALRCVHRCGVGNVVRNTRGGQCELPERSVPLHVSAGGSRLLKAKRSKPGRRGAW